MMVIKYFWVNANLQKVIGKDSKKENHTCNLDFFIKQVSQFGNFILYLSKQFNVRIISKKILREFWAKHSDSEQQLKSWYQETNGVEWKNPKQIKKEYPNASFLADNRVVFNIKGNKYRLIVKINYDYKIVWVRFIGTHAEYDKIDATKI